VSDTPTEEARWRITLDASTTHPPQRTGHEHGINPTAQAIATICSIIINADIGAATDLFTYGLTSLNVVRLVGAIEHDYGVRLSGIDIHDQPTPQALAAVILARLDQPADE
jgi:acyl carrier protein